MPMNWRFWSINKCGCGKKQHCPDCDPEAYTQWVTASIAREVIILSERADLRGYIV